MKKILNIGIDIDNVLTKTTEKTNSLIVNYITTPKEKELYQKNLSQIMASKFPDELNSKLQQCFQEVCNTVELFPNAQEVIFELHRQGHKIIFITARNDNLAPNTIENTKRYFQEHNIYFDKILFNNTNKNEACRQNNIDLLIDDSPSVLENIETNKLLFLNDLNNKFQEQYNTVKNWIEISEYIEEITAN